MKTLFEGHCRYRVTDQRLRISFVPVEGSTCFRSSKTKPGILFLGNSHLSAFSFAASDGVLPRYASPRLFCARGADLYFTKVSGNKIVSAQRSPFTIAQQQSYAGNNEYLRTPSRSTPSQDVRLQFKTTGGVEDISLSGVSAIFYVAGMNPFDLLQMGALDLSEKKLVSNVRANLGSGFFLRHIVRAVRRSLPGCKHYFIGRPLAAPCDSPAPASAKRIEEARTIIAEAVEGLLFDAVFRPGRSLLDKSQTATRAEFMHGGRAESLKFQGYDLDLSDPVQGSKSDTVHANRRYGEIVMRNFVKPLIKRRTTQTRVDSDVGSFGPPRGRPVDHAEPSLDEHQLEG